MRLFGSDRVMGMVERLGLPEDMPIDAKILSNQIEASQKRIEDQNFRRRKYVLTYDDVMNQQRNVIYKQRNSVLDGDDISETIRKMIISTVTETAQRYLQADEAENFDIVGLRERYRGLLISEGDLEYSPEEQGKLKKEDIIDELCERAIGLYESKAELIGEDRFCEIQKAVLLQNVDRSWMDHIDAMEDLKDSIRLQSYAQRDPVTEYRIQGADMFDSIIEDIREKTVRMILSITISTSDVNRVQVARPISEGFDGDRKSVKKVTVAKRAASQTGRNDLCPCGSGKKYKKCCGAPDKQ